MTEIVDRAEKAIGLRDREALDTVIDDARAAVPSFTGNNKKLLETHIIRWQGIVARMEGTYDVALANLREAAAE